MPYFRNDNKCQSVIVPFNPNGGQKNNNTNTSGNAQKNVIDNSAQSTKLKTQVSNTPVSNTQVSNIPVNVTNTNTNTNIRGDSQTVIRKTQRRRKQQARQTQKKVSFNLSDNNVSKYYCPELKPSWEAKIESGEPMQGDFKVKKVPHISVKSLFD
jgi:hypothetical protein